MKPKFDDVKAKANLAKIYSQVESLASDYNAKAEDFETNPKSEVSEEELKNLRKQVRDEVAFYNQEANKAHWDKCLMGEFPVIELANDSRVSLASVTFAENRAKVTKSVKRSSLYGMMVHATDFGYDYCVPTESGQSLMERLKVLWNRSIAKIALDLETSNVVSRGDLSGLTPYQRSTLTLHDEVNNGLKDPDGNPIKDPTSVNSMTEVLEECVKASHPELKVKKKNLKYVLHSSSGFNEKNAKGGLKFVSESKFADIFLTLVMQIISGEDAVIEVSTDNR